MEVSIILKNKQSKILIALKDTSQVWYVSSLAKASSTTYVHTCNFLNKCEAAGITSSEKHGKVKVISLTEKGLKIAEALSSITALINQIQPAPTPQPVAPPQQIAEKPAIQPKV